MKEFLSNYVVAKVYPFYGIILYNDGYKNERGNSKIYIIILLELISIYLFNGKKKCKIEIGFVFLGG